MPRLSIPTALRPYTDRQSQVVVPGTTVQEVLAALVTDWPDLKPHLFDEQGNLRSFVNIYAGRDNISEGEGLATAVTDDTALFIIPAIAGGSR